MLYIYGQIGKNEFIMYNAELCTFEYRRVDDIDSFISSSKLFNRYLLKYKLSTGKNFSLLKKDIVIEYFDEESFACKYCLILGVDRVNLSCLHEFSINKSFKVQGSNKEVFASDIDSVCISPSVRIIAEEGISNFSNVQELFIPNSVEKIRMNSIIKCDSLQSIYFSKPLKFVGRNCIFMCKRLNKIYADSSTICKLSDSISGCNIDYVSI